MDSPEAKPQPGVLVLCTQHFDILWRRPMSRYRQLEEETFRRVLAILDQHPEFRFTFSQANMLRYFLEAHPELAVSLRQAVREGAVEIAGGLDTLHDTNVISGESMIRNVVYGKRWTEQEFGVRPDIASLGDCFGSSGQMPQILTRLGYKWLLPGRMPGHGIETSRTAEPFVWTGIDGSSIRGAMMFLYVPPGDDIKQRVTGEVERLLAEQDGREPAALFLLGEEEMPRVEAAEVVGELADGGLPVRFGTYLELLETSDWSRAAAITGEFNVEFSGCFTTRIRTKQWSRQAEAALQTSEFLMAAEILLGLAPPSLDSLRPAWLALFECQFHDAIGGCHIDSNYRYMAESYQRIHTSAEAAIARSLARLGAPTRVPESGSALVCINPLPHWRRDVATIPSASLPLVSGGARLTPCQADGDTVRFIAEVGPGALACHSLDTGNTALAVSDSILESGLAIGAYRVYDGSSGPRMVHIPSGMNVTREGEIAARIVVREDTGDLWTERFSGAMAAEEVGDSALEYVESGPVFTKLVYTGTLPAGRVRWEGFEELRWRKTWYIYQELDRVDLRLDLEWRGKATEISVRFAPDINGATARARYEIPFGSLEREPYTDDAFKYGKGNWPALSWCDYSDDRYGVAFVHGGTPGCLAADGIMSFSVLRSAVSFDPGMFPCPPEEESFDNGEHSFAFSLLPHLAGDRQWLLRARDCAAPLLALPWTHGEPAEVLVEGLVEIGPPNVALATLKPADNGDGVVLRVYEMLGEACAARIRVGSGSARAFETAMDESSDLGPVDLESVPMAPFEIKTIRIVRHGRP